MSMFETKLPGEASIPVSGTIVVSAAVVTEDKRQAETATSVLSRAVSELGAAGIAASLSVGFPDDEDDGDTP